VPSPFPGSLSPHFTFTRPPPPPKRRSPRPHHNIGNGLMLSFFCARHFSLSDAFSFSGYASSDDDGSSV